MTQFYRSPDFGQHELRWNLVKLKIRRKQHMGWNCVRKSEDQNQSEPCRVLLLTHAKSNLQPNN